MICIILQIIRKPNPINALLCTSQFHNPRPAGQTPRHLVKFAGMLVSLDGQTLHRLALQKASNPLPTATIQKCSHSSNRLFKQHGKFPTKHIQNILSLVKLSYGGLLISKKLFIPESSHLTGFSKDSQKLQQNSEYRTMTNERGANAECGKNYEIPDQRFDTKVKCPTGEASFWVNGSNYIPPSTEQNSSEMPGRGVPGSMDGFGVD